MRTEWMTVTTHDGGMRVVDTDIGRGRDSWEQTLEENKHELEYCIYAYEAAHAKDYGIEGPLMSRIDTLRSAIYWAEWKLAHD